MCRGCKSFSSSVPRWVLWVQDGPHASWVSISIRSRAVSQQGPAMAADMSTVPFVPPLKGCDIPWGEAPQSCSLLPGDGAKCSS